MSRSELVNTIITQYGKGFTVPYIATLLGITDKAIYHILKRNGIPLRPRVGLKGSAHPNWKGNQPMHFDNGHQRARSWFKITGNCQKCGVKPAVDRHHIDGNSFNNVPSNIAFLCRKCHQITDGRIEKLKAVQKQIAEKLRGKPNPKGQSKQGDEYARLYHEGWSPLQIAQKFGVHRNSVYTCLKCRGVAMRPVTENSSWFKSKS